MPAPTINPTNAQTEAMTLLAAMVAASASFQEQAQAYTLDALVGAYVHYPEYQLPNQQVEKPYAVIYEVPASFKYRRLADGVLIGSGALYLQLGINMQNADGGEAESLFFNNWQGSVIQEVKDLSLIPGQLRCLIEQSTPPMRSHEEHVAALAAQLPFWFVEYTVNWDPFL
jgi:hypothetical protein